MSETMGQIIRRLRKERNLTQEELAEQLNITYQAVSRWENGTGMPDISQVVPLARVFGVSTDVLFGIYDTDAVADKESILDEYDRIGEPLEGYAFMMKVLEQYPGDTDFLRQALCRGSTVICCKLADDSQSVIAECERIARILINNSNDYDSIATAHECLADIYNSMGQYDHAKEHTDKLPDSIMMRSKGIRNYNMEIGNIKEAMSWDTSMLLRLLNHEFTYGILELGRNYYWEGQYDNAETCFKALLDMIRALFGEYPAYLAFLDEPVIWLARTYLKQNQPEKALDMLEMLPVFAEQQKQIVIGEEISDHPLIKPAECRYMSLYDKDALRRDCLDSLKNDAFDPIREDVRFMEILRKLEK